MIFSLYLYQQFPRGSISIEPEPSGRTLLALRLNITIVTGGQQAGEGAAAGTERMFVGTRRRLPQSTGAITRGRRKWRRVARVLPCPKFYGDNFEAASRIPVFLNHSMLEETMKGPFSRFSLL